MNKYLKIPNQIIDLHSMTTEESRRILDIAVKNTGTHIRIIVGKGNHSQAGPVLPNFVKRYLRGKDIRFEQSKISDGGEGALEVFL